MATPNTRTLTQGKTSGAVTASQLIAPGNNASSGQQRIVVDAGILTASGAATVQLLNKVGGTAITPAFNLVAGVPLDLASLCKFGDIKSEPGDGIALTSVGAVDIAYALVSHYEP